MLASELEGIEALILVSRYAVLERHLPIHGRRGISPP
jgi:hypothetical protein